MWPGDGRGPEVVPDTRTGPAGRGVMDGGPGAPTCARRRRASGAG